MKILVIKVDEVTAPIAFVANTKRKLFGDEMVALLLRTCRAWRYHDGRGWADSGGKTFVPNLTEGVGPLGLEIMPHKAILIGV